MSPRRSSRARTSQPSPAILQHANSSGSSGSVSRGERNTRSNHKTPSQRSSTQRSQSVDDVEGGSKNDFQRHRIGEDDDEHDQGSKLGEVEEEDDGDEEEEITRCLCQQQDYPGLPPSRREAHGRRGALSGVKSEPPANLATDSSDLLSDDVGSMFIQCDNCKVWQHGGCVGIMDEAMSPDEYYCEQCRKDLHRIQSEPNGQYSSQYLPVLPRSSPAVSSRASSRDTSKRAKDPKSRSNDSVSHPKRRSTMNSRDAAYEEELLQRALEESKEEKKPTAEELAKRRGKRSRSGSETNKQTAKRQRTGSPSPAPPPKQGNSISQPASDDESQTKAAANDARKQRPARAQRGIEAKDAEEGEAERSENANRRKGRSDRRKAEDSEHEVESPGKLASNEPELSQPSPGTPAPAQEPVLSRPSTRKSGRPPARRGGKLGRNQYTRDRDINGNGAETHVNSPRRGQSHEMGADSPRVRANGTHLNGGESLKPSKPRNLNPNRTTMTEMKRRVAGILEFISRMQVEMAVSGESASTPSGNGDQPNGTPLKSMVDQIESAMAPTTSDGRESSAASAATDGDGNRPKEKDFKELSSMEMMDVLTRHLLKWQQEYGKFGEK